MPKIDQVISERDEYYRNSRRYKVLRDMLIRGEFADFFAQVMQAETFSTETFDAAVDSVSERK
jgi:hypothetical protein